ncbi:hypothetical protein MMC26_005907 [Xylographa opegraphella]|nr:hypothetical protein [Xylographa opegraphella]
MAHRSPHPLILSPASRFAAQISSANSRSPSRSPTRRHEFTALEIDPLLSNLSPTSTLEALRTTDVIALAPGSRQKVLSESIADASTSERAFAIRAALAGKKLKEWYLEVKEWRWSQYSFEEPPVNEKFGKRRDFSHGGHLDQVLAHGKVGTDTLRTNEEVYWGSLPARIVQQYAERIEMIRDDMETLDVEELKDHVRGAHHTSRSSSSSLYEVGPSDSPLAKYNHLDDFTVLITATIIQALPYISKLNSLLDVWFVRLVVLRQVPGFLRQLEDARLAVDSAWNAIGISKAPTMESNPNLTKKDYTTMRSVLQERVTELGRRLDGMLDVLEGGIDRLPDHWIDSMESVQEDYETWVVDAERLVEENDWKLQQEAASYLSSLHPEAKHATNSRVPLDEEDSYNSLDSESRTAASDGEQRPQSNGIASTRSLAQSMDGKGITVQTGDFGHRTLDGHVSPVDESSPDSFWNKGVAPSMKSAKLSTSGDPIIGELLEVIVHPTTKQNDGAQIPSSGRRTPSRRPPPLEIHHQTAATDSTVSSDISEPGSGTSEYFSNMSSPEILDASRVEYFKTPTEDKFHFWSTKEAASSSDVLSRHSSQRTERSTATAKDAAAHLDGVSSKTRSRASSFVPEPMILESSADESAENVSDRPGLGLKRASVTSIEVLSRSELRNITVRRHSSGSSAVSRLKDIGGIQEKPDSQSAHKDLNTLSSRAGTPSIDQDLSPSLKAAKRRQAFFNNMSDFTFTSSPPSRSGTPLQPMSEVEAGPLSDRLDFTDQKTSSSLSDPKGASSTPKRSSNSTRTPLSPSDSIEDQLTARITSILTHIPARIRLTSGPEPDVSESQLSVQPTETNMVSTLSPPPVIERTHPSTPSITLGPAFPKTSKTRSHTGDSDIKLYHLHQPGRDAPIKLYVRLVGEGGERVMVRVGGGWADLAEYLKEYASHHGGRSISDSKFEIKGLPSGYPSSSTAALVGRSSGRSTPTSRPGSPTTRPSSALNIRKLRLSENSGIPSTPDLSTRSYDMTPGSADSYASSVRSSSRRLSCAEDDAPLGLSGPKSKNTIISPGKKAWVDGMLDQARKASGEKKRAGLGDFGDLGKIGGTRRVFFRGKTED